MEDGKTYDVILNSTNGMNQQIPTFTVHVDTLSEEYQIFGQDSIQLKNKSIYSLDKTAEAFYIKNGYMNIVPTFEYDLYKPVFFLLYYDGERTDGRKKLCFGFGLAGNGARHQGRKGHFRAHAVGKAQSGKDNGAAVRGEIERHQ